jgi:hypothetical protein
MSYLNDIPSYQDEKNTYLSWLETLQPGAEIDDTSAGGDAQTWNQPLLLDLGQNPPIHNDMECDDLWTCLHQWRRTGRQFYKSRMNYWRDYFKNFWRTSGEFTGSPAPSGKPESGFGHDHFWGMGLVDDYLCTGDTTSLDEAVAACNDVYDFKDSHAGDNWGFPDTNTNYNMLYPTSGRQNARCFLTASYLSNYTSDAKVLLLRNRMATGWAEDPTYAWYTVSGAGGCYFGEGITDFYADWSTLNDRLVDPFHLGWIVESHWRYIESVGGVTATPEAIILTERIKLIADFIMQHGLLTQGTPAFNVTGVAFGLKNCTFTGKNIDTGTRYHQGEDNPVTMNTWLTHCLCNILVLAYKLGRPASYYTRARLHFLQLNGAKWSSEGGDPNDRWATIHHMVDSFTGSGTNHQYFEYNRAELFYTYWLFERGGAPTLI